MTGKILLRSRLLRALPCLILAGVYIALPLAHLSDYAWNYDEGPQLQAAALANAGYPLYSETVLNKPPLLTWILQLAFRVGGTEVPTARLAVLSVTALGFLALGLLAEQWWGPWSGAVAMGLLLALPTTLPRAAVVMNDLPAMAAVLISLAAGARYARVQRWYWLVISAVAFSASVGFHLILAPLLLPLAGTLLARCKYSPYSRSRLATSLVFGVTSVVALSTFVLAVDWHGLLRWVGEYNAAPVLLDRSVTTTPWSAILSAYLAAHWPLIALGVIGVALQPRGTRRLEVSITITWLAVTLLALLAARLSRSHYLVFLSYPLVVLAAGGTTSVRRILAYRRQGHQVRPRQWLPVAILSILALFLVFRRITVRPVWSEWTSDQRAAQTAVANADLASFIVADDQFLAFAAGRLVPPSLADTSFKRIETGFLRTDEVIGAMLRYGARLVVLRTDRLTHLPGFIPWLTQTAAQRHHVGGADLYRVVLPSVPDVPVQARLGNAIELLGYSLSRENAPDKGDILTVTLFWRSVAPIEDYLTVFVHLTGGDGRLIWQHDGVPLLQAYPTSVWLPGITVPDPHPVHLAGNTAPDTVTISAGMYRWPSLERMPAYRTDGSRWPDDRIHLTTLELPTD